MPKQMPEASPRLRAAMLEVVDNQLRDGTPPETQATLQRLTAQGYSIQEAKRLIGAVALWEMLLVLRRKQPYDEARYVAALRRLPTLPSG